MPDEFTATESSDWEEYSPTDTGENEWEEYRPVDLAGIESRIRSGFTPDQEDEARATLTTYFASKAGENTPFGTDYKAATTAYLGKTLEPLDAASSLKSMLDRQGGEFVDNLDKFNMKTPSSQWSEVQKYVMTKQNNQLEDPNDWASSIGTYLANKVTVPAVAAFSSDQIDPNSEKWKRAKQEYVTELRLNSPRFALKMASKVMTDKGFNWAERALLTGTGSLIEFDSLPARDKSMMQSYLRAIAPEFEGGLTAELQARVKSWAVMRAGSFHRTARELRKLMPIGSDEAIASEAIDRLLGGKYERFITDDGKWVSDKARETVQWAILQHSSAPSTAEMIFDFATGTAAELRKSSGRVAAEDEFLNELPKKLQDFVVARRQSEFAEQIRDFTSLKFVEREGLAGFAADTGFKSIGVLLDMSAAAASGLVAGPAGVTAYSVGAMQGDLAKTLRDAGADPDDASLIAWVAAVPYAAIERAQVSKVFPKGVGSFSKFFTERMKKDGLKALGQAAKNLGVDSLAEIGEEAAQEVVLSTSKIIAKEWAEAQGITNQEIIDEFVSNVEDAIFTMPIATIGGRGMRAAGTEVAEFGKSRFRNGISSLISRPGGPADVDLAKMLTDQARENTTTKVGNTDDFVPLAVKDEYRAAQTLEQKLQVLLDSKYEDVDAVSKKLDEQIELEDAATIELLDNMDRDIAAAKTEPFVPRIDLDNPAISGLSIQEIEGIVKNLNLKDITVVQSVIDLPAEFQDNFRDKAYVPTDIEGTAGLNQAFLIADNLASLERAEQVALHEAVGHLGLLRAIGTENFDKLIDNIAKDPRISETLQQIAEESEIQIDLTDPNVKREQVEEILARAAEKNDMDPTIWQRIVAASRNWLRKLGLVNTWTDNDIRVLLSRGRSQVVDDDSPQGRIRASLKQNQNDFRNSAIVVADRMIRGEEINEQAVQAELKRIGLQGQYESVMAYADSLAKTYDNVVKGEPVAGEQVVPGLRELEASSYYTTLIDRVHSEGIEPDSELGMVVKAKKVRQEQATTGKETQRKRKITEMQRKSSKPVPSASLRKESIDVEAVIKDPEKLPDMLSKMYEDVKAYAKAKKITGQKRKNKMYRLTLSNTLNQTVRNLTYDRARDSLTALLAKMKQPTTGQKRADAYAKQVIEQLNRMQQLTDKDKLLADFAELFTADVKKKVGTKTLLKDRKITEDQAKEFRLANQVYRMGQQKVDNLKTAISDALQNTEGDTALQDAVATIESEIPGFKDKAYKELEAVPKLLVAADILGKYGALSSRSAEYIASVAADLEARIESAQQTAIQLAEQQSKTIRKNIDRAQLATTRKSGKRVKAPAYGTYWFIDMRLRQIAATADQEGRQAMDELISDLRFQESSDMFDTLSRTFATKLNEIIKETYGVKIAGYQVDRLNTKRNEYAKYDKLYNEPMSKSQLMQLIGTWDQDMYKSNMERTKYNEALIEQMRSELSAADVRFMEAARAFYAEMGAMLDEVSMRLFGTPVSNQDPNYLPVVTDATKLWNATEMHALPLMPPSLNERIKSTAEIDTTAGLFQVLDSRMRQNAHFIAWSESSMLARNVFADRKTVKNIRRIHGDRTWKRLTEHLNDIYSDARTGVEADAPVIKRLQSALVLRALSGNMVVGLTQLTSFPAYALHYGTLNFSRALKDAAMNPEDYGRAMMEIWKSDQFKNRIGGGTTEFVQQALQANFGDSIFDSIPEGKGRDVAKVISRAIKQAYQLGMVTTTLGDITPIILAGPAMYLEEIKNADGDKAKAMSNTWKIIQQTQQSYANINRSRLLRRWGLLGRVIGAFTTTPGQYLAFESAAFNEMKIEYQDKGMAAFTDLQPGSRMRKLMNAVFVNHVLLPGLYYTLRSVLHNWIGDNEWDEDDTRGLFISMLVGPFSAYTIGFGLTSDFLNEAMGGRASFGKGMIPLSQFKQDAKLLGAMVNAGIQGDFDEMLEDAAKMLISLTAPSRQISKAIESR